MKLKKVIAAVSAAAMVIGCMPNVWAESADVPEEGVSVLPAGYEPVTYNVTDMPSEDSNDGFHIVNPYVDDAVIEEVALPEKTKDISVCFDVDNCDTTFWAWCNFWGNNWETGANEGKYDDMLGGVPRFAFNQSGSYELIIPVGLLLEAAKEDEYEDNDFDYLETLNYVNLRFNGMVEDSSATVTITDVKAYQKSHTIEECSYYNVIEDSKPDPEPEDVYGEINGFEYVIYSYSSDDVTIIGYTGKDKDVVIPEEIEGRKNIHIMYAFSKCDFIETIKFSSSVTLVGRGITYLRIQN